MHEENPDARSVSPEASRLKYIGVWFLASFAANILSKIVMLSLSEFDTSIAFDVNLSTWVSVAAFCGVYLLFKDIRLRKVFPWVLVTGLVGFGVDVMSVQMMGEWLDGIHFESIYLNSLMAYSSALAFFYIRGQRHEEEEPLRSSSANSNETQTWEDPALKYIPKPVPKVSSPNQSSTPKTSGSVRKLENKTSQNNSPNQAEKRKTPSAEKSATEPTQTLEVPPDVRLILEYKEDARKGWEIVKELPSEFASEFINVIADNPKSDLLQIAEGIALKHQKSLEPYDKKELNEAFRQAKELGPDAEKEFIKVIELLGEDYPIEDIMDRLEERFHGNQWGKIT